MSGKIDQYLYPFNEPKQAVVTGNDPSQNKVIVSHIQNSVIRQSGSLAQIRHLHTGVENQGTPEELLYLYDRYDDADCIRFTIKAEENLHTELKIDLLIINLSFSSTPPYEYDESDKYELGEQIRRSVNFDCSKLFLLTINDTLINKDPAAKEISKKLQDLMETGEFVKAKDLLTEKGIRQLINVHNYLVSYYPSYKKQEKIAQDVQVVYTNIEEIIGARFYTKLLNLDTSAITIINQY